jgi:hypothetical protein
VPGLRVRIYSTAGEVQIEFTLERQILFLFLAGNAVIVLCQLDRKEQLVDLHDAGVR